MNGKEDPVISVHSAQCPQAPKAILAPYRQTKVKLPYPSIAEFFRNLEVIPRLPSDATRDGGAKPRLCQYLEIATERALTPGCW